MSTRTPSPWHADHFCIWANGYGYENTYVAGTATGLDKETQAANRDFIVRACNSHDALVAALEVMVSHPTNFGSEQARAALAAAKGKP